MKRLATIFFTVILSVVIAVPAFAGKVVIKLGHIAEPIHPYGQGADHFAKLVKEKSGGEIEVKVFPTSQLGGQKDLIEGLIFGTVDMALVGTAVLGQFQPQISLFDLPFLFQDREHAYKSLDTVGMKIGKDLEPKGIKLLGYMENGIRHLTNNIRPVKTPADMTDLKIRVMTNKIYIEMMKALGASPTPMAFGELYSAMQQGTVDGQENPSAHIWTKRFFEVQKYASKTAHAYAPEPVVISMITWSRLTPAQQKIIQDSADEAIAWQRQLSEKQDKEFWDKIKATGKIEVIEVDRTAFIEATRPVYKQFADVVGQDNIDAVEALKK
ncbi:DctP family TRAP transporter solute-binding subunit [Pseudodesulfovibrio senegalensis]|jgi:tripartite ATP-independent transporter DctP family solute receptor|uniref:DctP family TRAP transporter solute-binding subunit n=1 Tax=Pseudodesulfovibrio senegalensis TaxID=1721087 RepID=A0A6N6N3J8_9BACT|nr:DctP family TRAP transporter solute-binding subunit [Pseudodesulfovibrio senegalensis]KAB1442820.1 DctP family TRAP transporter solute-binding subunit [Pseudodesulfovibrio senegalensis]